jgi:trigger factor
MDGELFEGGSAEDMELTLGSRKFIDTFEDQLVGHVPGDDVTVNVTFPEEYQNNSELAGKPATFEVEILDIQTKELPEIDDEFAQDISEFDSLAELREDLAKRIQERREANLDTERRLHILRQLVEKAAMEVPDAMYLARLDEMMDEFTNHIEAQGMQIDNYLRFAQISEGALRASWREQAMLDVNSSLVLESIAKKRRNDSKRR